MSDERRKWLEEVRAREKAATPGPWMINGLRLLANDYTIADFGGWQNIDAAKAAINFVANARTDTPRLLADVERLEGLLSKANAPHDDMCSYWIDASCSCGVAEVLNAK